MKASERKIENTNVSKRYLPTFFHEYQIYLFFDEHFSHNFPSDAQHFLEFQAIVRSLRLEKRSTFELASWSSGKGIPYDSLSCHHLLVLLENFPIDLCSSS